MKLTSLILRKAVEWKDQVSLLDSWIRQVTSILSKGSTIADQSFGELRTVSYNSDRAPVSVPTSLPGRPIKVEALNSVLPGSASFVSGSLVQWTWTGTAVSIESIDGLALSTDYDVTLFFYGG